MCRTVLVVAFAGGCTLSYEEFTFQARDPVCRWMFECLDDPPWEDVDDCLTYEDAEDVPGLPAECEYAPELARGCLRALEELECDDVEIPACEGVLTCDPEPP